MLARRSEVLSIDQNMLQRLRLALILLSLLLILTVKEWALGAETAWHDLPGGRWRELPSVSPGKVGFTPLDPLKSGIAFTNTLAEELGAANRTLYNGSGVAAGDFDGDGLPDLVLCGLQNKLALFKNLGNWNFRDVTA